MLAISRDPYRKTLTFAPIPLNTWDVACFRLNRSYDILESPVEVTKFSINMLNQSLTVRFNDNVCPIPMDFHIDCLQQCTCFNVNCHCITQRRKMPIKNVALWITDNGPRSAPPWFGFHIAITVQFYCSLCWRFPVLVVAFIYSLHLIMVLTFLSLPFFLI